MKDSFMFFRNMRDIIKSVPRELQLDLREAIEDYVFDGIEPTDWAFKAIIQSIKPSLEYVGRGAPKGNQNAKKDGIEEIEEVENNSKQIKQKNQLSGIDLIETKKQETKAKAETKEETETKDLNTQSSDKSSDCVARKKLVPLDWYPKNETVDKLNEKGLDAEKTVERFINSCRAKNLKYVDFDRAILAWDWSKDASVQKAKCWF